MTRRSCLLALSAASTAYAKSWDQPAFPNWSAAFVEKVLSDSPWARPFTAKFESFGRGLITRASFSQLPRWPRRSAPGGLAVRTEANLTIRWANALPVRQAMALLQYGKAGLDAPGAVALLQRHEPEYAVEVAGFPATLVNGKAAQLEQDLKKTARLWMPGQKPLAPTDAYVPEHGLHLLAALRFPRIQGLQPSEAPAELIAQTQWFGIQQKFKLKLMIYRDFLAL